MTVKPYAMLFASVEIVAGVNDRIRFNEGGASILATVAPGTYYFYNNGVASYLWDAVCTALATAGTRTWTSAIAATTDPASVTPITATLTSSGSATIEWTHSTTTFPARECGFLSDTGPGTTHAPSAATYLAWVANQPTRLSKPFHAGAAQQVLMEGGARRTTDRGGPYKSRHIAWEGVDGRRVHVEQNPLAHGCTFEMFWSYIRDGRGFLIIEADLNAGALTLNTALVSVNVVGGPSDWRTAGAVGGTYVYFVLDQEDCNNWDPDQPEVGLALFDWRMRVHEVPYF